MIENPDFNAREEMEPEEIEEVPQPDIELPVAMQIELQEREIEEHHKQRGEEISLSHHAARCGICQHHDRDAIEQGFLHWESPTLLALEYGLGRRRAIYRHARALGLFEQRGARTRRSLEFVMEQAETVTATASDVIRAVRAYSCLGEDGRWTEPAKRIVIENVNRTQEEGFGVFPASSDQPLASRTPTLGDGHARPSKNAVTRAPSTKVRKLMGTLFSGFGRRFS